jgi:hypothetical protein
VDPVSESLLLIKSGSAGNRTWNSGSVTRNFDQQITEAVDEYIRICKFVVLLYLKVQEVICSLT